MDGCARRRSGRGRSSPSSTRRNRPSTSRSSRAAWWPRIDDPGQALVPGQVLPLARIEVQRAGKSAEPDAELPVEPSRRGVDESGGARCGRRSRRGACAICPIAAFGAADQVSCIVRASRAMCAGWSRTARSPARTSSRQVESGGIMALLRLCHHRAPPARPRHDPASLRGLVGFAQQRSIDLNAVRVRSPAPMSNRSP